MDQDRITEFINKAEITSIVNSYFRALDEKNFDAQHYASILTPQAKVTRPNGASLIGPEEISASHAKSFTRFEGSQHVVAGHEISLDGSTANVRANLIAMHMWQGSKTDANKLDNFFVAGGVIHATLMQSDGQWRISQMSNAVLWRAGGFRDMMQTGTVTKEAQSLNVSHPNEPVLTSFDLL
jgi:ketosteroid isomerase-like protein